MLQIPGSAFSKGVVLSLCAGICWGGMGVCSQVIFAEPDGMAPIDLVTLRLIFAGIFLLITAGPLAIGVMLNGRNAFDMLLAGLFVFLGQFCFMQALLYVNAGTAAIVLMTVPFWVAFWQAIAQKRVPRKAEIFCFVLAMSGVVLIVTHGDFSSLNFDARGVAWGLGSAFATTGYTIQPRALLMRAPAVAVMGWAMFFGGVIASLFSPPWAISYDWSMKTTLLVLFVVSVGTVVAFWCYLLAVRLISPVIVGLLICSEPLSAYILSVAFLQMRISEAEIFGAGFVLAAVIIVTTAGKLSGKKSSRAGS